MCTQSCPNLCGPRWTVAHQGPLSMKFSRQDYWSGLSFPPPEGSSQPRGQNHVHGVTKELDMTEQVNKQKETKIFNFTDLKYLYTTWNKYQNILKFYPLFKWLELGAGGPSSQPPAYSPSSLLLSPSQGEICLCFLFQVELGSSHLYSFAWGLLLFLPVKVTLNDYNW